MPTSHQYKNARLILLFASAYALTGCGGGSPSSQSAPTTSAQSIQSTSTTQSTESAPTSQVPSSTSTTEATTSVPTTQVTSSTPTTQATPSVPTTQVTPSTPTTQATPSVPTTQVTSSTPTTQATPSVPTSQITSSTPTTQATSSVPTPQAAQVQTKTASTQYSNSFCQDGIYPAQWEWTPPIYRQPAPATSGTPKIEQIRDGKVIATYTSLGGDGGYSKENSSNGEDTHVGPFRRQPYTQWKSGDTFLIYPAVYKGKDMQIYVGPNVANNTNFNNHVYDIPENITIRGVTVNGQRPVIVNSPDGANIANYGKSLIYVEGTYDSKTYKVIQPAKNITIENLDVVDAVDGGKVERAGIYVNGVQNFTLRNVRISGFKLHNTNGIFATPNNSGTLLLDGVELDSNGGNNGPAHNAYINDSAVDPAYTFHVTGSWSHDSIYGHELKSRAQRTIVEGSYLSGKRATSGTQTEAYLLDVPNGGVLIARNNVFVKNYSGNNSNGASLTFGVEGIPDGRTSDLTVEHNTFVAFSRYYDDQNHQLFPMFISSTVPGSKNVSSNVFVGYCSTGNPSKDFRGTNFATLNFNEIDQTFRPLNPSLTGNQSIISTPAYMHKTTTVKRSTVALGARD